MHMTMIMDMHTTMDMGMATPALHSSGLKLPMRFLKRILLLRRRVLIMKQLWAMDMLMLLNMRRKRKITITVTLMLDTASMVMLMQVMVTPMVRLKGN